LFASFASAEGSEGDDDDAMEHERELATLAHVSALTLRDASVHAAGGREHRVAMISVDVKHVEGVVAREGSAELGPFAERPPAGRLRG